ncbi:MAG: nucleoside hydrolase [Acidimicrobiales bacterium]|nr:MAG: nucleoside hydrolase [Acidimicrobiales bacterium]
MRRFLIDTDTASDDAVALVMALRHPDVQVEAITVACGNVGLDQAVQNALYTVEFCGADVPVYAGAQQPMMRTLETAQYVHGADGMGDCGLPLSGRTPAEGRGCDVLVDTILGAPGEITLVTLGPLTNVALAVMREPAIVDAVDRVVVMGGTGVNGPGNVSAMAEYNFWADPEAAQIVARSGLPLELVGWDISIASAVVTEARHEAMKALGTPLGDFAVSIARVVREFAMSNGLEGDDLPDPIAMAHAIDPSGAEMRRLWVDVMVGDGPQRGVMDVDQLGITDAAPNIDIVSHYPSDHFFEMLFGLLAD